eukprot:scaffold157281_cov78-Attheya_sp.AAC.1
MDGAIHGWWDGGWTWGLAGVSGMVAEVEVATCSAPCLGFREVRGITVDLEAHVACIKADSGFGFGGTVVEELGDGLGFGLGVLRGSQGTKDNQHGGVHCTGIIEESADNFLCSGHFGGLEGI